MNGWARQQQFIKQFINPNLSVHDRLKTELLLTIQWALAALECLLLLIAVSQSSTDAITNSALLLLVHGVAILTTRWTPIRIASVAYVVLLLITTSLLYTLQTEPNPSIQLNYFAIALLSIVLLDGVSAVSGVLIAGGAYVFGTYFAGKGIDTMFVNSHYSNFLRAFGALVLMGVCTKNMVLKTYKQNELQTNTLLNTNSTKDKLFSIISHDLRSPILSLRIQLLQFKHDTPGDNMVQMPAQVYNQLLQKAASIYQLTDNLLNWSVLQRNALTPKASTFDLAELAQSALTLYENELSLKRLQIQTHLQPAGVFADEIHTQIIVRNLLHNAIKFTPEQGTITITTSAAGSLTQLIIQDTGVGMDTALAQTGRSQKGTMGEPGTGLGLQLVGELTQLNQGQFSIQSQPGHGTTVTVRLPAGSVTI